MILESSAIAAWILKLFSAELKDLARAGGDSIGEKLRQLEANFSTTFAEYLTKASQRYGFVKTVLYRAEPVPLNEFYVPVKVQRRNGAVSGTETVTGILKELGPCLIITAPAGAGKSTLLAHLFLSALGSESHVPVFVELRNVETGHEAGFLGYLCALLGSHGLDLSVDQIQHLLRSGRFLFCLDGFDEVSTQHRGPVEKELLLFVREYYNNSFIVTSRPDSRFIGWKDFFEVGVAPLEKPQVFELVERLDYDEESKADFLAELRSGLFETHRSFLSNPLLATLMLMTFQRVGPTPPRMHEFYEQAFDTLLRFHDRTKVGYIRRLQCGLEAAQFRKVIELFSITTYLKQDFEFSHTKLTEILTEVLRTLRLLRVTSPELVIEDLIQSVCFLTSDGYLLYAFSHRSFQEYFAAVYITSAREGRRRRLLDRCWKRAYLDDTVRLAWEIDQEAVEDDFLFPRMTQILEDVGWTEGDLSSAAKAWILQTFLFIRATPLPPLEVTPSDAPSWQLIRLLHALYRPDGRREEINLEIRSAVSDLLAAAGRQRDREPLGSVTLLTADSGSIRPFNHFYRREWDLASDLGNAASRLWTCLGQYLVDMKEIYDNIREDREAQERGFDALLLDPGDGFFPRPPEDLEEV